MEQRPYVGMSVLIVNSQNQLLLGKRLSTLGKGTWATPGGHLEFNETFEDCAIREVREETGLVIVAPRFLTVTNDILAEEGKHYVTIFMKARYPEGQCLSNPEPDKTLEWSWYSRQDLPVNLFASLAWLLNQKKSPLYKSLWDM